MHLHQAPDKLAAVAAIAAGMNSRAGASCRSTGDIARRNAAIVAALDEGHSPATIASKTKLTGRTVEDIAKAWRKAEASRNAAAREPLKLASFGGPLFEFADPRALATRDVESTACRWPIDEEGGFRFCGAPATVGYRRDAVTYCACHGAKAFVGRARATVAEAA